MHLLSDNALFQTRELSLPISDDFPNQALQTLLHHQLLTHLSLQPTGLHAQTPKPCDINAITEILSCQKEQLIELTISRVYYFDYISIKPSADMERFGDALFL